MHKSPTSPADIEKALARLMPVALSDGAQSDIEKMIDGLEEGHSSKLSSQRSWSVWITTTGIAAAAVLAVFVSFSNQDSGAGSELASGASMEEEPEMIYLTESDRVEGFSDEGLYVDAGGSAVRKVSVRVVEESQIRDAESGIVVMLTEPREEMYMVPVSTF